MFSGIFARLEVVSLGFSELPEELRAENLKMGEKLAPRTLADIPGFIESLQGHPRQPIDIFVWSDDPETENFASLIIGCFEKADWAVSPWQVRPNGWPIPVMQVGNFSGGDSRKNEELGKLVASLIRSRGINVVTPIFTSPTLLADERSPFQVVRCAPIGWAGKSGDDWSDKMAAPIRIIIPAKQWGALRPDLPFTP